MRIILMAMISLLCTNMNAQKFITKTGNVNFSAGSPIEKIEGNNRSVAAMLDAKTGTVNFIIQIKSFVFEKQLMQEHFNENYMESEKFPKSSFKGDISNLSSINFSKDGEYPTDVAGKLMVHGVSKDVKVSGKIIIKNGKPTLKANFNIILADYGIEIPGAVKDKISKEAKVQVNCSLDSMQP
ncbi:MAG: YceI family protein [Bacteroidetes bacterium]|nr:YceI family protein [Bacteroidota bacterium]